MTVTIAAVHAGLGVPSSSRMLVDRIAHHLGHQSGPGEVVVEVIELRELAGQIANNLVTGYAEAELDRALKLIASADGIVAVTPIFNASYAGLFKSFFDLVEAEAIVGTPVLLGATGGTARHSLAIDFAMRPLFAYLKALPVATGVFAATEEWGGKNVEGGLEHRIARGAGELLAALRRGTGQADGDAAQVAPTIAATAADFTTGAQREAEKRAEHEGFAALMTQFAGERPE